MGCDLLKQKGLNSTERTNGARGCSEHLPYGTTQQLREEGPQDPSPAPMGTPTPLGTHMCHAAACCCSPTVMAAWMWGAKLRAANQAPKTQRGAAGSPPFALWGQGGRSRLCSLGSFSVPTPRGAAAPVPNCHRPPHGDPQGGRFCWDPPPPPPWLLWVWWRLCVAVKQPNFLFWEICAIAEGPQSAAVAELCCQGGGVGGWGALGGVVLWVGVTLWLLGAHGAVWVHGVVGNGAQALPLLRGEGTEGSGKEQSEAAIWGGRGGGGGVTPFGVTETATTGAAKGEGALPVPALWERPRWAHPRDARGQGGGTRGPFVLGPKHSDPCRAKVTLIGPK